MDESPYASPRSNDLPTRSEPPYPLDTVIFVVNFGVSVLLLIVSAFAVAAPQSPFDILGAIMMAPVFVIYAFAEWRCWYRRGNELYKGLGGLNLAVFAFLSLGLFSTLAAMLLAEEPVEISFIIFVGLGLGLPTAYLGFVSWRRLWGLPRG